MKLLPAVIVREKNALYTPYPWITLLDVTISAGVVRYFCSNNEDVTFGGQLYTAFPFRLDPTRQTSKGEIPTISIQVCNVMGLLQADIEQYAGGVGAEVLIQLVHAGHLDADMSELALTFSVLSTECDAEWVTFSLGAASPLRRRFPPYRFVALHCNWEFKSAECSYAGAETECDRSYKRCEAIGNTPRFGNARGLNLKGWRIV